MDRLQELITKAHEESLSLEEIKEMTSLARKSGSEVIRDTVNSFLGANSIACQNLIKATELRNLYNKIPQSIQRRTGPNPKSGLLRNRPSTVNSGRDRRTGFHKSSRPGRDKILYVTSHAMDRYIDRIDNTATIEEAEVIIRQSARTAIKCKTKTYQGNEVWFSPTEESTSDGFYLVIARDSGEMIPTVVTLLSKAELDKSQLGVKKRRRRRRNFS